MRATGAAGEASLADRGSPTWRTFSEARSAGSGDVPSAMNGFCLFFWTKLFHRRCPSLMGTSDTKSYGISNSGGDEREEEATAAGGGGAVDSGAEPPMGVGTRSTGDDGGDESRRVRKGRKESIV